MVAVAVVLPAILRVDAAEGASLGGGGSNDEQCSAPVFTDIGGGGRCAPPPSFPAPSLLPLIVASSVFSVFLYGERGFDLSSIISQML